MNQNSLCKLGSPIQPQQGYSSGKKSQNNYQGDRYIPSRVCSNLNNIFLNEEILHRSDKRDEQMHKNYSNLLQSQIFGDEPQSDHKKLKRNIFKFNSDKKNNENNNKYDFTPLHLNQNLEIIDSQKTRKIQKEPFKVLDAPTLQDDYYLNLLDWSTDNYIAVGLDKEVYTWSACNNKVSKLCDFQDPDDMVCSVAWSQRGQHLAVGNNYGQINIFDTVKQKIVKELNGHSARIGSLAWNGNLLASGSRDKSIIIRDLRVPDKIISQFIGHKQEICGLKWSFDENILASGGNDNKLFLWNAKTMGEMAKFNQHQAAVKALAWSPHHHNILSSGGGTADRSIRFWNTHSLSQISSTDTGSQVCNLMFSKTNDEIVSTHGYSLNQICVWDFNSMQKLATLTGHTMRVLYLAMSPCGKTIVTGAGDETLRFWNVFPSIKSKNEGKESSLFPSSIDLR